MAPECDVFGDSFLHYRKCKSKCGINLNSECWCTNSECLKAISTAEKAPASCLDEAGLEAKAGYELIMAFKTKCQTAKAEEEDGNSQLIIGAAVGGGLIVLMLTAALCYYRNRLRKQQRNKLNPVLEQQSDDAAGHNVLQNGRPTLQIYKPISDDDESELTKKFDDQNEATRLSASKKNELVLSDRELLTLQIDHRAVTIMSRIGDGASAEVWLGEYNQVKVAIKRLKSSHSSFDEIMDFIHEIKLMSKLRHPRICRCYGAFWQNFQSLAAVLEYATHGDLRSLLAQQYSLGPNDSTFRWFNEKMRLLIDILEGLVYLHSLNIIHRDLKSRNVLCMDNFHAKLTDFGISREREVWQDSTMTGGIGTMLWMAPEVLKSERNYTNKVDIYAFGVILIELDTLRLPYANNPSISMMEIPYAVSRNKLKPEPSPTCPMPIRKIIDACLQYQAEDRPSGTELYYMWETQIQPQFEI